MHDPLKANLASLIDSYLFSTFKQLSETPQQKWHWQWRAVVNKELPEEIKQQILKRLPVKSLMRFTCVSKWWGSIIADPKFTLSHYKLASLQQTLSRRLLLWNNSDFESLDLDTSSVRKLTFPYKQPGWEVQLLGSCNGLVFLGTTPGNCHWDFYVWNPTTRFVQKLPDPSFSSEIISLRKCGFGYVSAADDYKLVLGAVVEERIKMFSWRANSWKMIEVPLFRDQLELGCSCVGTVLNEALHWIQTFDEPSKEEAVLVFDLVKEEFRKLPLPT